MTLLERLQAHRGGLLRIKTQLFWYGGRGWDRVPGRICLILDVATAYTAGVRAAEAAATAAEVAATPAATALLLIDGQPHWVWVAEADIELLDGGDR